jgi:hypothetical protein
MAGRTYLIFGDIEGKLDMLRVACTKCARKGRYSVRRLIEKYGRKANMMKWREQLNGDCQRLEPALPLMLMHHKMLRATVLSGATLIASCRRSRDLGTRLLVRRYSVRVALDLGINRYTAKHREKLPTWPA